MVIRPESRLQHSGPLGLQTMPASASLEIDVAPRQGQSMFFIETRATKVCSCLTRGSCLFDATSDALQHRQ